MVSNIERARPTTSAVGVFPKREWPVRPVPEDGKPRFPGALSKGRKGVRTEEIPMIKYLAIISAFAAFAGAPALAQQSTAPAQTIQDKDKDSAKGTKGASENAPGEEMQDRGTVKGIKPGPGVTTGSGSGAGSR